MKINKKFMRNRMQLFKSKILLLLPLLLSISCQQEIIQSYTSENLEIKKISEHCYVHITYLETEEYGRVACNGMLVVDEDEVLVFDTPTSEKVSRELLDFLENDWNKKVVGVVINHFHVDCLGGLKSFHDKGELVYGAYASDGFFGSSNLKNFDGVLAMYHDQGLTGFKSISFDEGVNFTAGLPIVRTSPDHGTAFDITGKGIASERSFRNAYHLACDVYKTRQMYKEITANPLKIKKRQDKDRR